MKKYFTVVAVVFFLMAVPTYAKIFGDFNDDGSIDLLDLIPFLRHISGEAALPEAGKEVVFSGEKFPSPTLGGDGANVPVSGDNIAEIHQLITTAVYNVYLKVFEPSRDGTSCRINGDSAGYADVTGIFATNDPSGSNIDITVTFYDYSDNGQLYLSGKIHCCGDYPWFLTVGIKFMEFYILGTLEYSGSYKGRNTYLFKLGLSSPTELSYRGSYSAYSWDANGSSGFTGLWPPPRE